VKGNLFIFYELRNLGENYDRIVAAIKRLDSWANV
jgi:hypothetical protein